MTANLIKYKTLKLKTNNDVSLKEGIKMFRKKWKNHQKEKVKGNNY